MGEGAVTENLGREAMFIMTSEIGYVQQELTFDAAARDVV